jgi:hypothetical protein
MFSFSHSKGGLEKMFRKIALGLAVAVVIVALGSAAMAGTHSGAFLRMGVGARALAMGGNYVAIANDATAGYWNPAGLALVENVSIELMYSHDLSFDRSLNYGGISKTFDFGSLGFSYVGGGMDDLDEYDSANNRIGAFDTREHAFILSYATRPLSFIRDCAPAYLGISFKGIMQDMGDADGSQFGVGADVGAMFSPVEMLTFGVAVQDIGTKILDPNDSIPYHIRLGVAASALDDALTVTAGATKTRHIGDPTMQLGAEYWTEFSMDKYAGFRVGLDEGAFAAGLGLKLMGIGLNYAYVVEEQDFLGENHRFSLGFDF